MITDFDLLMRQADLLVIADRALSLGAHQLYEQLIDDAHAEKWDYESIARHLTDARTQLPELEEDIQKFLSNVPLTPA